MASIRKHGDGFQIRYYTDGKQHCEQVSTFEAAEIRVAEIDLAKAKGHTVESRPHTIKFAALARAVVDHYDVNELRSRDDIECRYRLHLFPYFGNRKAVTITGASINAYVVHRKGEGAAAGTINRELEAMKRAYKLGMEQGTVASMPTIKLIKESNVRTGFFTRAEVDCLCFHLREPLNRFVLFAFLTAWRYDEIRNLKWSNVDFERGEIRLDPGSTKNGEGRTFPMTAELRTLLSNARTSKDGAGLPGVPRKKMATLTPYVFVVRGRQVGQFRKRWQTACKKAGLPVALDTKGRIIKCERLFHDLRRSGVREFIASGMPEKMAMMLSGHKTRSVLDRYNVVTPEDLRGALRFLDPKTISGDSQGSG